jgi:hypothetical protein
MFHDGDDTRIYTVVINDVEQYSIWPQGRAGELGVQRRQVVAGGSRPQQVLGVCHWTRVHDHRG